MHCCAELPAYIVTERFSLEADAEQEVEQDRQSRNRVEPSILRRGALWIV